MQPPDAKRDETPFKKVFNAKTAVWVAVLLAVVLLCLTATVAFALKSRKVQPASTYSPMSEIEARYGLADLAVTSSNGLGVDAGTTPVAPGVMGAQPAISPAAGAGQPAAPKIGPAPSAGEAAPLQSVAGQLSHTPVNLQTDVYTQGGSAQADIGASSLELNVKTGL